MPAIFERLGISFQYPENWTIDEADVLTGRQSVTVYSPGGGFWSVTLNEESADPVLIARSAADAMQQEYEGLEVEKTQETVAGHELVGYDMDFFYLDLISTAAIRCLRVDATTYTIFYQAEDREYQQIHRVFEAMTVSLLMGLDRLKSQS